MKTFYSLNMIIIFMHFFCIFNSCNNFFFYIIGPISTTPEMPTAADMQLAAAVGSRGKFVLLINLLVLINEREIDINIVLHYHNFSNLLILLPFNHHLRSPAFYH